MGRTARETEAGSDKCPLGWWHGRGGEGGGVGTGLWTEKTAQLCLLVGAAATTPRGRPRGAGATLGAGGG